MRTTKDLERFASEQNATMDKIGARFTYQVSGRLHGVADVSIVQAGRAFSSICLSSDEQECRMAIALHANDQRIERLRDEFAMAWLQGYIANPSAEDAEREDAAERAYKMADAMMVEREQKK